MFTYTYKLHVIEANFKELHEGNGAASVWGRFLMSALDLDTVTVTKQIVGFKDGKSLIVKNYMKLSDSELLELTPTYNSDSSEEIYPSNLNHAYIGSNVERNSGFLIPAGQLMFEVISLPVGGITKSVAQKILKKVSRKLAIKGIKGLLKTLGPKITRFVLVKLGNTAVLFAKLGTSFVKEFTRAYFAALQKNSLKGVVNKSYVNGFTDKMLSSIIETALKNTISKLVTEALAVGIQNELLGKGADPVADSSMLPPSFKKTVDDFVMKKVMGYVAKPFLVAIKASILAINITDDNKVYNDELTKKFLELAKKEFSFKAVLSDSVKSTVTEFIGRPEAILGL